MGEIYELNTLNYEEGHKVLDLFVQLYNTSWDNIDGMANGRKQLAQTLSNSYESKEETNQIKRSGEQY